MDVDSDKFHKRKHHNHIHVTYNSSIMVPF